METHTPELSGQPSKKAFTEQALFSISIVIEIREKEKLARSVSPFPTHLGSTVPWHVLCRAGNNGGVVMIYVPEEYWGSVDTHSFPLPP